MKSMRVLEDKREIAAGVVIAIFGVAILTVVLGYYLPSGETTTLTEFATSTVTITTTSYNSTPGQLGPWTPTTAYPFVGEGFSCVANGGYVYCVGGASDTTSTAVVNDLNLTYFAPLSGTGVGTWSRTTDYPIGMQDESCVANSGYVYCVGGYVSNANGTSSFAGVYYASLSSSGIGHWSQTTSFPYPAPNLRCLTDSDYVYCIGAGGAYFAPLSPSGVGKWVQTSAPPTMTAGCSAIGGYVYCFGGGSCPATFEVPNCPSPSYYAPLSSSGVGAWKNTTELPTPGYGVYVTADSYEYYFTGGPYVAHLSADGIGGWATTTPYPQPGSIGACVANELYVYCIGASVNNDYFTRIAT